MSILLNSTQVKFCDCNCSSIRRQTTISWLFLISMPFPWPMWNSPTFPGFKHASSNLQRFEASTCCWTSWQDDGEMWTLLMTQTRSALDSHLPRSRRLLYDEVLFLRLPHPGPCHSHSNITTTTILRATLHSSPRPIHWLFRVFLTEAWILIKQPEVPVYKEAYVNSRVNIAALFAVHLVHVNFTEQYSDYIYFVTIATVVAHQRQTIISLTSRWPMSNSPTFPGFPGGCRPELFYHQSITHIHTRSVFISVAYVAVVTRG